MPNLSRKRRAWSGDSGAVMLRTMRRGRRSVTVSSSHSIVIAAGGSTTERISNRRTSSASSVVENASISTTGAPTRNAKSTL